MRLTEEKPEEIAVKKISRVYPATPDGSQWEVLVHFLGDVGNGQDEIIAECHFRSYNGGLTTLGGVALEAGRAAANVVAQYVEKAEKEIDGIQIAKEIPAEFSGKN